MRLVVFVQIGPLPPLPERLQSAQSVVLTDEALPVTDVNVGKVLVVIALAELRLSEELDICAVELFVAAVELLEAPTGLSNVVPLELAFTVDVAAPGVALRVPFEVQI